MKVKGEVDALKRSVDNEVAALQNKAVKIAALGHDVRAANLQKIIVKLQEWQKK